MKIEKTKNDTYRVRPYINGKRVCLTFDKRPTQKEISDAIIEISNADNSSKDTFEYCANSYINSKSNILSPSTVKGYKSLLNKSIPDDFKNMKIKDITQTDIQLVINDYAVEHAPKTVRNMNGFISSVMGVYRPSMTICTTLPQKAVYEPNLPTEKDIEKILDISKGTMYHIAIQLGILGMRRSEICALTLDDIEGNTLHINKALVMNEDNKWVVKATKTAAGTRDIYLPDNLLKEIQEEQKIYEGYPNSIYDALQGYCAKLKIKPIRFHDLRHYYASYAHENGMSDADIMASGGWKSDYTMKSVYRHAMQKSKEEMQKQIANKLL